jgi:hypothetical protein
MRDGAVYSMLHICFQSLGVRGDCFQKLVRRVTMPTV